MGLAFLSFGIQSYFPETLEDLSPGRGVVEADDDDVIEHISKGVYGPS